MVKRAGAVLLALQVATASSNQVSDNDVSALIQRQASVQQHRQESRQQRWHGGTMTRMTSGGGMAQMQHMAENMKVAQKNAQDRMKVFQMAAMEAAKNMMKPTPKPKPLHDANAEQAERDAHYRERHVKRVMAYHDNSKNIEATPFVPEELPFLPMPKKKTSAASTGQQSNGGLAGIEQYGGRLANEKKLGKEGMLHQEVERLAESMVAGLRGEQTSSSAAGAGSSLFLLMKGDGAPMTGPWEAWTVNKRNGVPILDKPKPNAQHVGTQSSGIRLRGKRFGHFLKLEDNHGYVQVMDDQGKQILEKDMVVEKLKKELDEAIMRRLTPAEQIKCREEAYGATWEEVSEFVEKPPRTGKPPQVLEAPYADSKEVSSDSSGDQVSDVSKMGDFFTDLMVHGGGDGKVDKTENMQGGALGRMSEGIASGIKKSVESGLLATGDPRAVQKAADVDRGIKDTFNTLKDTFQSTSSSSAAKKEVIGAGMQFLKHSMDKLSAKKNGKDLTCESMTRSECGKAEACAGWGGESCLPKNATCHDITGRAFCEQSEKRLRFACAGWGGAGCLEKSDPPSFISLPTICKQSKEKLGIASAGWGGSSCLSPTATCSEITAPDICEHSEARLGIKCAGWGGSSCLAQGAGPADITDSVLCKNSMARLGIESLGWGGSSCLAPGASISEITDPIVCGNAHKMNLVSAGWGGSSCLSMDAQCEDVSTKELCESPQLKLKCAGWGGTACLSTTAKAHAITDAGICENSMKLLGIESMGWGGSLCLAKDSICNDITIKAKCESHQEDMKCLGWGGSTCLSPGASAGDITDQATCSRSMQLFGITSYGFLDGTCLEREAQCADIGLPGLCNSAKERFGATCKGWGGSTCLALTSTCAEINVERLCKNAGTHFSMDCKWEGQACHDPSEQVADKVKAHAAPLFGQGSDIPAAALAAQTAETTKVKVNATEAFTKAGGSLKRFFANATRVVSNGTLLKEALGDLMAVNGTFLGVMKGLARMAGPTQIQNAEEGMEPFVQFPQAGMDMSEDSRVDRLRNAWTMDKPDWLR